MSAALTLATPDHLDRLQALVAACHEDLEIVQDDETRRLALAPLLDGVPHGAAYLIGPPRAPIGYIIVSFGWSVEFGGLDGFVDELFVRPGVRGRGIASEVLLSLPNALRDVGLKALHLEVARDDDAVTRLYRRAGFARRDKYMLMSRVL